MKHPMPACTCRRRFLRWGSLASAGLALGAAGMLGPLAGCSPRESGASGPAPLEITAGTVCELDGMLLADYPGPKAQIHRVGVTTPEFYCDTVELFATLLRPEAVHAVAAAYVQDMGRADWEQPQGHWIDARQAFYVRGSKRRGSMGPTLASFAQQADAQRFIDQWGGTLLRYGDIKPEMVDLSGGTKGDGRM